MASQPTPTYPNGFSRPATGLRGSVWGDVSVDDAAKTHNALRVVAQIHLLQLHLTPWRPWGLVSQHGNPSDEMMGAQIDLKLEESFLAQLFLGGRN